MSFLILYLHTLNIKEVTAIPYSGSVSAGTAKNGGVLLFQFIDLD
jgi:hypothetical protein